MGQDKKNISIDLMDIPYFCIAIGLFVGLMPPEGIINISPFVGKIIWNYYRWLSCLIVIMFFVITHKRIEFEKLSFFQFLFFLYILIVTIINGASIKEYITNYLPIVCIILMLEIYRPQVNLLLNAIFTYLFTLAIINLMMMIVYPDGMYTSLSILGYTKNWLLGYKSSFQVYLYPLFIISLLNINYNKWKTISVMAIVITLIQSTLAGNTMLVVVFLFVLIAFITNIGKSRWIYNPFIEIVVFGIINIGIITFRFINVGLVSRIITSVLHKNLALSGRDFIYAKSISQIADNLIFGHGRVATEIRQNELRGLPHSHNQVLECLFQGGLVGLVLYMMIIIIAMNCIYHYAERLNSMKIVGLGLIGIMLMGIVEITMHRNDGFLWLIISLCVYIPQMELNYMDDDEVFFNTV